MVIMLEYQNIKMLFAKGYVTNWPKEMLWLKWLKILCRGHVISDLEEIVGTFYEKELFKKQIKKNLDLKK